MQIQAVKVNASDAAWKVRGDSDTVLDVPLAAVLNPDGTADIRIDYTISYAPLPTDTLDAREPFPLLAVHDETGWREEVTTKSLDFVYSETALYAIKLHTARDVDLYSVGTVTHTDLADNDPKGLTYNITTGPVRDFVFVLTKGWGYFAVQGAPVPIHVYYKGSQAFAQQEADITVQAMTYFDSTFGPYPYSHLTMLVLPYSTGGEEYPTLIFNDNARDLNYRWFIATHELAHQWFYGVAGDDIAKHAWLDESLAQISLYLFFRHNYGQDTANQEWTHILTWANRPEGHAAPDRYSGGRLCRFHPVHDDDLWSRRGVLA